MTSSESGPSGDQSTGASKRSGGRRTLRGLGLFAAATVMAFFAFEWAVSRYFPVGGQVYVVSDGLLYDAAPGARRIQRMGKTYLGEGDVGRVHVAIGADRFRGADLEKPKRRKRVLVLGDSLVMAENVPQDRTFVVKLGDELETRLGRSDSIETVNAGRSGYGPDQSLLLFERDAEAVDPDLVVCVLCAHNDFGDLMRNKLFRLGEDGSLMGLNPHLGPRMTDRFEEVGRASRRPAWERLWEFRQRAQGVSAEEDVLPPGTMRLYVTALESQAREHLVDRDQEVVTLFEDVYDIDMAAGPDGPWVKAKRDLMQGVLARMVAFAKGQDVPLIFVVVPSAVDVCDEFGIRVDPLQFPGHSKTRLAGLLMGAVGLAGGVGVDVTPALVNSGPADRYFVGGTDMHWNSAGQGAAASFVAEEVLRDSAVKAALVQ